MHKRLQGLYCMIFKPTYIHAEGKEALGNSNAYFNKKASASYKELSATEKQLLELEGPSEVQI